MGGIGRCRTVLWRCWWRTNAEQTPRLWPRRFARGDAARPSFPRGAAILLTYWLMLFWMYRRKIFLRV